MANEGKVVRKLNTMESFRLVSFMQDPEAGYVAVAKTDREYAEFFNSHDFLFTVTEANIAGARKALEIPATKNIAKEAAKTAAVEVIEQLAAIDAKLERIIRHMSGIAKCDI